MPGKQHQDSDHDTLNNATDALDPRPHVATLRELASLGWRVTEIRPDRIFWRVTVTRYDGDVTLGVTDVDPDVALEEALRYASVDEEPTYEVISVAPTSGNSEATTAYVASNERAPGSREDAGRVRGRAAGAGLEHRRPEADVGRQEGDHPTRQRPHVRHRRGGDRRS